VCFWSLLKSFSVLLKLAKEVQCSHSHQISISTQFLPSFPPLALHQKIIEL
jgi:hypothetical protein